MAIKEHKIFVALSEALWPLRSTKFLLPSLRPYKGNMLIFTFLTVPL